MNNTNIQKITTEDKLVNTASQSSPSAILAGMTLTLVSLIWKVELGVAEIASITAGLTVIFNLIITYVKAKSSSTTTIKIDDRVDVNDIRLK